MNLDKFRNPNLKIDTNVKLDENNKLVSPENNEKSILITDDSKVKKNKKKRQKRCGHKDCRAKLKLTSIECKCGIKFCAKHFSFTKHDCSFDYLNEARKNLEKKNVLGGGEYDKMGDRI